MFDQAFDSAETFGKRKETGALEDAPRRGEVTVHDKRHDAAERAHLFFGELMLWVTLESGIDDPCDLWIFFQPARNSHGVAAVPLHAQRQSLETAQREKAVERSGDRADGILQKLQLFAELVGVHHHAAADDV